MFNKATSIRIAKLLIQETGSYNTQYLRPYVTDTTIGGRELDSLAQRMVGDTTNMVLSPLSVVGSGSGFLTRSATPEKNIVIANGWEQKRIRFLIEVVVDMFAGGSNSHFIMGYTDFPGVNPNSQSIAPEMVFYINSITKTRNIIQHTPHGTVPIQNVCSSQHLLYDSEYNGFNSSNYKRAMRPEDIYTTMGNALLFDNQDFHKTGFDTRNTLRSAAITSDRSLNTPANYITNVVNNYVHAAEYDDFGQSEEGILDIARKQAMSSPNSSAAYEDPFLNAISNLRGGQPVNGHFTYAELLKLDPNTFNVTNYVVVGNTTRNVQHSAGQTSGWGGSDRSTMAATILSNSVPALMMDLMITSLVFKSTNHDIGGQMRTEILHGHGFSNTDMVMNYERFKNLFEKLVVTDLTYGNMIGYAIEMQVDLLGETWIKISIDGEPFTDFVTPSFCDALFSPIITVQQDTIINLANDFGNLIESVKDRVKYNSEPAISTMV